MRAVSAGTGGTTKVTGGRRRGKREGGRGGGGGERGGKRRRRRINGFDKSRNRYKSLQDSRVPGTRGVARWRALTKTLLGVRL